VTHPAAAAATAAASTPSSAPTSARASTAGASAQTRDGLGPSAPRPASRPGDPHATRSSAKDTGPAYKPDARTAALMRRQARLLPAAGALLDAAHRPGSDLAGVTLDVARNRLDVYRTRPRAALPASVHLPKVARVVVHRARYSAAQLSTAATALQRDARSLGDRGVRIAALSPRQDGAGLDLTVLTRTVSGARTPRALGVTATKSALRARYGNVVSTVRSTSQSPGRQYFAGWRFNDFAPWYGGDRILEGCTTGFPAVYGGSMKVMTAAHCGGSGTVFHNGPNTAGGSRTMGAVSFWSDSTDISVIDVASSTNSINVGPAQNSSIRGVAAWEHPVVGQYLCQSGSYTGETCGLRVVDTGQSQCISWFLWWCTKYQGPMADVINSAGSGSYAAGHGDSGAPLYWYDANGLVHATGQVHGQLFPNARSAYPAYFPDTMWCPAPEGWQQRCSSGFSFAHMPGM